VADKGKAKRAQESTTLVPFEVDGTTTVATLDQINMDRYAAGGALMSRHLHHEVLTDRTGWAVVLVAVQDYRKRQWEPPRYVLTRWRKEGPLWTLHTSFRFGALSLDALQSQASQFMERSYELAAKAPKGNRKVKC